MLSNNNTNSNDNNISDSPNGDYHDITQSNDHNVAIGENNILKGTDMVNEEEVGLIIKKESKEIDSVSLLSKLSLYSITAFYITLYCISGTSLTIMNKLAIVEFPYPNTLLIIQNSMTVILLLLTQPCIGNIKSLQYDIIKQWMPLVFLFLLLLVSSLQALYYVSAATLIVIRNLSTLFVALLEYMFWKKIINNYCIATLIGMLIAATLYAKNDMGRSNFIGYIWLLINIIGISAYQVYNKKLVEQEHIKQLGSNGMSLYNNLLSLPLLLIVALATNEFNSVYKSAIPSSNTIIIILLSSTLGFLLSTTGFKVNQLISATSIMVANNVNKFALIIISEVFIQRTLQLSSFMAACLVLAFGWFYSQIAVNVDRKNILFIILSFLVFPLVIYLDYSPQSID